MDICSEMKWPKIITSFVKGDIRLIGRIVSDNERKLKSEKLKNRIQIICTNCNKIFEKVSTQIFKNNFCSRKCYSDWHKSADENKGYKGTFTNKLKIKIRKRDNNRCKLCGVNQEVGLNHDVHHINYIKSNSSENNLITLCKSCHSKTNHGDKNTWSKFLSMLIVLNEQEVGYSVSKRTCSSYKRPESF